VDVLTDALRQLADRVPFLTFGHGVENVELGTGCGIDCRRQWPKTAGGSVWVIVRAA
jgi:hypothetical protein